MIKELKKEHFQEDTTARELDLSGIVFNSPLHKLIEKLNSLPYFEREYPKESIMHYEHLCDCDDLALCEHRLQFIVDFIKKNYD